MSRFNQLSISVYIYFIFSLTTVEVSASKDIYFYETEPETSIEHQVVLRRLDQSDNHKLQKRQVLDNRPLILPPSSYHEPPINDTSSKVKSPHPLLENATKPILQTNLTRTAFQVPSITNDTKTNKKKPPLSEVPYILPTNINATEKDVGLLGVNGTGQRKIYPSSTQKPLTLPTLYPPLLHDIPRNKTRKPNFDDFIDNISISKFNDKDLTNTLAQHNITNETISESYAYYNSTFNTNLELAEHYWVNLNEFENSTTHELLSSSHRRAANVSLSFEFPFYGHLIQTITITTGGFLYTGDYVHPWLAATQYIAPLMANFDTTLSNDSFVRYLDNGTAFTVLWENVALKDRPDEGNFTFQTTLHKNGDIVFVYKIVPTIIENIKDDEHPVKIGLSDAYIIDSKLFFLLRKTIYEYHRVNFQKEEITNGTVIYLKALPTCLDAKDCMSCLNKNGSTFQCAWCPGLNRCSSGIDRHRQAWMMKGCEITKIKNKSFCSKVTKCNSDEVAKKGSVHESDDDSNKIESNPTRSFILGAKQTSKMGLSGVLAIMLLISMIVGITMWVIYAYRNPHTTSGQILIRYRPSQWSWKRGEARYTAATIHM